MNMIERVAEAIYASHGVDVEEDDKDVIMEICRREAIAAIEAMRDPSPQMGDAFMSTRHNGWKEDSKTELMLSGNFKGFVAAWNDAIDAALKGE